MFVYMPNGQKGTKKGNHRHGFQLLLGGDSLVRVGPANFSLTNYESELVSFPLNNKNRTNRCYLTFLPRIQVDLYSHTQVPTLFRRPLVET